MRQSSSKELKNLHHSNSYYDTYKKLDDINKRIIRIEKKPSYNTELQTILSTPQSGVVRNTTGQSFVMQERQPVLQQPITGLMSPTTGQSLMNSIDEEDYSPTNLIQRNKKKLAPPAQSLELKRNFDNRNLKIEQTMRSFFDTKKLYLKSSVHFANATIGR